MLRHLAILPATWRRKQLIELALRQAEINWLDTCLCLGLRDVIDTSSGSPVPSDHVPTGIPVIERLVVGPVPDSAEQRDRRVALRAYCDRWATEGFVVGDGLEGGRTATADDLRRLAPDNGAALPPSLANCETCGDARGEYLALQGEGTGDATPRVLAVHCRCANHHRCAGCGGPLHEQRLSAWHWDEGSASVRYVAAYLGLGHRCGPDSTKARDGLLSRPTPTIQVRAGDARGEGARNSRRRRPGGHGA